MIKTYITIFLSLCIFLMLPVFLQQQVDAQYNESPCSGISGATCKYVSSGCAGGFVDNYCPTQSSSIKCCLPTTTACYQQQNQGKCQTVGGSQACGTSYVSGYCPGSSSIQCCKGIPPPTGVNATCTTSGTSSTVKLTWTLPAGYSYAFGRIHDAADNSVCNDIGPFVGTIDQCTATPGHTYNSWAHTTNSAGYPYSAAVNAAPVTCPVIPACPNNPAPQGTIVSTGVDATASNNTANTKYANDGVGAGPGAQYWDSGATGPQYIEFKLNAPQQVSGIQLIAHTGGAAVTNQTTQVTVGTATNPSTVAVQPFTCAPTDGQVINLPITQSNVQYIRVNTSESTNNVGWYEVSVYGSAPGSQTTTPGIIFSGDLSSSFGQGSASAKKWVVGGLTYPEVFNAKKEVAAGSSTADSATVKSVATATSYQHIYDKVNTAQAHITPLSDPSICPNLASSPCSLPTNLASGVYQATTSLSLNGISFPQGRNYIFLIDGDLTILGNIVVPNGSTAFFTTSGSIIIDKNVGTAVNLFPLPAGQLQGIYSADKDFTIEGIDRGLSFDCTAGKDKMLNIEGAIVTNALGNGGTFIWHRDLCGDNPRYPTFTIRPRLDMLLNLPEILMQRTTTFREDTP